jgi:WD40 repeat protein
MYLADHTIVCRRADDLALAWTRKIEPDMFGVRSFSMTPDGGIVAAAVMDTMFIEDQKAYYIGIFAGKDGSLLARLHLNGFECLAISPDGKLLGVGQRIRLKSGEMQSTVNIYEVSSGQQVATIVHDRLRVGRGDFGNDEIRCEFTPDGRYLITSSIHVKIWDLHA